MDEVTRPRTAVTYDHCAHVPGPFFHGTRAAVAVGAELVPGHRSHFRPARALQHVYFTAVVETAVWGAELAAALHPDGSSRQRGRIYLVEPQGPFEVDPNVTDKRFPGNPTESYRTTHPLRVTGELETWTSHPPEVVQRMLDGLARLTEQGLDLIED